MTASLAHLKQKQSRSCGRIVYTPDFIEESIEGEVAERDALMVLLPALVRACDSCGDVLDVGTLVRFTCWGRGAGFVLQREGEGMLYNRWQGVGAWEDFEDDAEPGLPAGFSGLPIVGEAWRLHGVLKQMPGMLWYGIRDSKTNQWDQASASDAPDQAAVQRAIMMVLQLDMLLKGQDMPRGRARLDFAEHSFWLWASPHDHYLMYWGRAVCGSDARAPLAAAGEAFLLGGVAS